MRAVSLDVLAKNSGVILAFNLILTVFVYFLDDGSLSFVTLHE